MYAHQKKSPEEGDNVDYLASEAGVDNILDMCCKFC